tara:strand:- start:3544 stop:3735 length:192 start_codon:yes stop_codon:yes gene_type:complete
MFPLGLNPSDVILGGCSRHTGNRTERRKSQKDAPIGLFRDSPGRIGMKDRLQDLMVRLSRLHH